MPSEAAARIYALPPLTKNRGRFLHTGPVLTRSPTGPKQDIRSGLLVVIDEPHTRCAVPHIMRVMGINGDTIVVRGYGLDKGGYGVMRGRTRVVVFSRS